jgi:glycerophosphoryl diester phosphodiesterase
MEMGSQKPLVIGHRGAAGEAPENTLASFQLAMEQGADGVELDVHLTKDGEIVVCHDATLDRTTNGSGAIYVHTYEDIRSYDAGAWFAERFAGERVPLLGEVFDLVPNNKLINVEIKHSYSGQMEERLLQFLRQRDRLKQVVISSFNHKCILRIKQLEPDAKVGLLYAADLVNHADYARQLGVDIYSLHPYYQLLGKADVEGALAAEMNVYPYTVNAIADLRQMIQYGVSGIITDFPARVVGLMG